MTTPGARVTVFGAHLSPDAVVYFGGLQAREVTFISSSALHAVTPYLRPGTYKLTLKSGEAVIRSEVEFTALSAPVDSSMQLAEGLIARKQTAAAIAMYTNIAATDADYDVRAYAHFRAAQLYLAEGDYRRGGLHAFLIWDPKVSMGVQTSWRYGLLGDQIGYFLSESNDHDTDFRTANSSIAMDVTANPEPRFWRALIAARFGKMEQAKADLNFVLTAEPENPSYLALAAYIGVLDGDNTRLGALRGQQVQDGRALRLLGQAAYLAGDPVQAQAWWTARKESNPVWARMGYWAGRKHVKFGQTRVGNALIAECAAMAPDSREGKEAREFLRDSANKDQ